MYPARRSRQDSSSRVTPLAGWCAAVLIVGACASAQAADPELEQITVTARKVAESAQDVPMSLSIISGEELEAGGIEDLQDLGREVSGLNVASYAPGQNQITLRGLSGNNTVALYEDDAPLALLSAQIAPSNWFMDPGMFDLARIEVLKGPQGTLYGASSLGGTVRYITNQPDLTRTSMSLKTVGSYTWDGGPNGEVDALLNQPLISDLLAVRVSWFARANDGYIDSYPTAGNNYLGTLPGPVRHDVNTENTNGGRLAFALKPLDAFSATLSSTYQNMRVGAPSTFDEPPGDLSDPIQSRLVNEASTDKMWLEALTLHGDIGPVHLTSATDYFTRGYHTGEDDSKALAYLFPLPGDLVAASRVGADDYNRNWTEEVRGNGSAGPLHALIGLYYSRARAWGDINWPAVPAYEATLDGEIPFFGVNDFHDVQKAVFGEITFDITAHLQATVGAREFRDTQSLNNSFQGVFAGSSTPVVYTGTASAGGTTPKYGLAYHVTDDIMTYADVEKGYRAGGPGPPVPANCLDDYRALGFPNAQPGITANYGPDTIWNYEIGAKTAWLDRRLTVDPSIYYIRWQNVQQTLILACSAAFVSNFGAAQSKGVDLDAHYVLLEGLRLNLSGAVNEANLTKTIAGAQGAAGQSLEYAPKWSGSLSMEYNRSLGPDRSGFARASVSTTSREYTSYDSTSPFYDMAGYSLVNVKLGMKRAHWQTDVFVENLLDKRAITDLYNAYGSNIPTSQPVGLNRPRTIGVEFRVDR